MTVKVKVFDYIPELEAFVVTKKFIQIAEVLWISEWTPVVWICRLFAMDNDYGEHLFDNWDERELVAKKARSMGIDEEQLMIVAPWRFQDGRDGPCHSDLIRKGFWTNVFDSLHLDIEFIIQVAHEHSEEGEYDLYETRCERARQIAKGENV